MKLFGALLKVALLAAIMFSMVRTDRALKKNHLEEECRVRTSHCI